MIVGVVFNGLVCAVWIVPLAVASWKMLKGRPNARVWGIAASIVILSIVPLGTVMGIYGLRFFFGEEGKRFYAAPGTAQQTQHGVADERLARGAHDLRQA